MLKLRPFSCQRPSIQAASRTNDYAQLEDRILFSASPVDIDLLDAPTDAPDADIAWDLPDVDASYSFTPDTLGFNELVDVSLLEVAANSVAQFELTVELLIVDTNVDNWEELVHDALENRSENTQLELLILDPDADGIEQISNVLQQLDEVSAIQLVSHGTEGQIQLGKTTLRTDNLPGYAAQLAGWTEALSQDADLLIYGCNLAGSADGRALVEGIAALTGADVAASLDNTGHAQYGGNWDLEYATGSIETAITVSKDGQETWFGLLATLTVTTTADVFDGDVSSLIGLITTPGADGFISLREAVIATNNTPGADTIVLPAGMYTLSIGGRSEDAAATGDLDITDNLTINGAGAAATIIDGGAIDRVFDARSAGNTDLSNLTIQNGDPGGGDGGGLRIASGGNATLSDVVIRKNTGANGAGIHNSRTLTLMDSELIGNTTSDSGGGLYNDNGNATLDRVTFSGNIAGKDGGGIHNSGGGANLTLTNVTLSGNTATDDGGGLRTDRSVDVTNSTIALNTAASGGGIHVQGGGDAVLMNTILYNNGGGNANTNLTSLGYNVDSGNIGFAGPGDQSNTDPSLGPLQYNGGPTQTHALLAGSPAINAGTLVGAPTTDQRGVLRDASPDIGAFEATTGVGPISDTDALADTVTESAAIGATVGITAFADDPDITDNVTYSLDFDAGGLFTIDGTTGVVTVNNVLDAETSTSHLIIVRATSDDTSFSTRNFTITVTDVDEFNVGPITDADAAVNEVNETAPNGTPVGITASASDADVNDGVTYSLDDDSSGRFAIDPSSGVVSVANSSLLDFESWTSHNITVRATSDDLSVSTQNFTIDIVDDPTEAGVGAISDADGAANAVGENAPAGTAVGFRALATDADASDTVSYSLDDDAGGRFQIDGVSGTVTVRDGTLLDYESATSHTIVVRATSTDTSFSTSSITISLADQNDNAPVVTPGQSFGVDEGTPNGTVVGIALATDADTVGALAGWAITAGNTDGIFAIDPQNGELTVVDNSRLDFATTSSYALSITVDDGANLSAAQTVVIQVKAGPLAAPPPPAPGGGGDPPLPEDGAGDSEEDESGVLSAPIHPAYTSHDDDDSTSRQRRSSDSELSNVVTVSPIITLNALEVRSDEVAINAENQSRSTLQGVVELTQSNLLATGNLDFGTVSTALVDGLSQLEDDLMSVVRAQTWSVGYALGVTTGLSVGYIVWILRSGYLLTSVLSSMATWMVVDPLLVLDQLGGDDKHVRVDKDDSLESMMDQ